MKDANAEHDDNDPIAFDAAEWLVKRDRGFTSADQDAFFDWLAADPRHSDAFALQQRTWQDFDHLAEWCPEHSAEPNPDLLARPQPHRGWNWREWLVAGSLAACLAVALFWIRGSVPPPAPVVAQAVNYAAQGYERIVLEDGSVVELNTGARVEVDYRPTERRVHLLQGEANFSVAKNHERPFIVRAGGVDVRAVGTAFNVRLSERSIEVLVTEGKVRVDDAHRGASLLQPVADGSEPLLIAGQKIVVEPAEITAVAPIKLSAQDLEQATAWRPVIFDFDARPLHEVVAEFNARNRIQLELADAALADLPIVASFRSDNVEGFVRLLEMTTDVRAERTDDVITLHVEH